jgi:hypothetical protein
MEVDETSPLPPQKIVSTVLVRIAGAVCLNHALMLQGFKI